MTFVGLGGDISSPLLIRSVLEGLYTEPCESFVKRFHIRTCI
jgi:hypothetical protein